MIAAAQTFIAAGKLNVPVLEITQAADVGMGSFYNHFDSKEELFDAALTEVLDVHGALLDELTESLDDPAETFARSFRLTGRLFRRRPQESRVLLSSGLALLSSDRGVAPRARRDIIAGVEAGRFHVDGPEPGVGRRRRRAARSRATASRRAGSRRRRGGGHGHRARAGAARHARRRGQADLSAAVARLRLVERVVSGMVGLLDVHAHYVTPCYRDACVSAGLA